MDLDVFPEGRGETKELRAQWALEETGLPYRFHALDHTAGDLDSDAYRKISPFRHAPVIDDDGFVVAESGAVVLYMAEKAGTLIPADVQGRHPRRPVERDHAVLLRLPPDPATLQTAARGPARRRGAKEVRSVDCPKLRACILAPCQSH